MVTEPTCCNYYERKSFDVAVGQAGTTIMKAIPASLNGVLILEPRIFSDERGYFLESYNEQVMGEADVHYKATDFYVTAFDRTLAWNDPDLKIDWQLDGEAIISAKDSLGIPFRQVEVYE